MSEEAFDETGYRLWRRGITVQLRVIIALIIRLMMTKFGRSNIGFLWLVLEPMILCTGVLLVRSVISGSEENGIPLITMLVTGYLPLTLWRHISNGGALLLRRAGPMLYHRDISVMDFIIATILLELGGCTLAAMIVYWSLYTLGLVGPIYDLGLTVGGWFIMLFLSSGIMIFFAVITELYEWSERFIQPFQYLIIPLSGFFFMVNWLPTDARAIAWYMPTIHCYEMIRAGVLGPSVPTFYDPWYPALWSLLSLALWLPLLEKARQKIHFA